MNLIVLMRSAGRTRHIDLARPRAIAAIALAFCLTLIGVFWAGLQAGSSGSVRWLMDDSAATVRSRVQDSVDALALRIGGLDAQVLRLNALGKRLTDLANIRSSEFDFDKDPPQGGPESDKAGRGVTLDELGGAMGRVERLIDFRNAQLHALQGVMLRRQITDDMRPTGRPVGEGYMSSRFGERMDPFNGEEAFHKGVDFAAPTGTDVIAVAAGVVTFAGRREGYGELVEVQHGDGLVTRYGHNSQVLVSVGEIVQRGQALAKVGSTGRSTGPHVHFEVLRNGSAINPASFVGN
jgi:murein DD-endopeptidase MepM/ murein hydrolase activator NlpD